MWKTLAVALVLATLVPAQAQALENEDLLALVAMPLAVAAVSEVTDVPMNELMNVVTLLNDADVSPPQFIEVVRYVPVALVVQDDDPDFVTFVRTQQRQGLRGVALVNSIEDRLHFYGMPDVELDVVAPRIVDIDDQFIPQVVRTRVAEVHAHPHGGPPGQLKKVIGVQTGAEIVHGTKPGRGPKHLAADRVVIDKGDKHEKHEAKPPKVTKHEGKGHGKGKGKG